jgi:hypothetical protein
MEEPLKTDRTNRVLSLVILFLLSTTLFNTLRANRVEERTTSFRKEATHQMAITKKALAEQERINATLSSKIDSLLEARGGGARTP